jgi:23S rRNA pseudouridine1911/1915/1917 synthase
LKIKTPETPRLIAETPDYLVVFKPSCFHTVPLKRGSDTPTLLDWCALDFPEIRLICGKNPWEGGVLHRLDYETQGLVLIARTQDTLNVLREQQVEGFFIKEYLAVVKGRLMLGVPRILESDFRSSGPGRKEVRPLLGNTYRTEILKARPFQHGKYTRLYVRIRRGFRHQIRCHLSWLGYPIVNDRLYSKEVSQGHLRLCARAFSFRDPVSGETRNYSL